MNEEEVKAAIAAAIAEETKGLKAKNSELLANIKALQADKAAAEEAAEAAAEEVASKAGDVDAIKNSMSKKHRAELDKVAAELEAANKQLTGLLIDNTVNQALAQNNVPSHAQRALSLLLKEGATIKNGEAFTSDGTPLSDHVSTFFTSDEGRAWLPAPSNSGASAPGSTTKANAHGYTKENFDSRVTEWSALAKHDPVQAKAIAESIGRSDMASYV